MNTDRLVVRVVVYTLAAVAVGGFVVQSICAVMSITVPDSLDRYTFGALTALMALLSKTSTTGDEGPQPVTVTNTEDEPVPVDATDGGQTPSAVPPPPLTPQL